MSGDIRIYVRGPDMTRLMEVGFYDSLEATLRNNDGGDWILDLPSDSEEAELLKDPWRAGIVVMQDHRVLFSGPVTDFTLTDDADGTVEVRGIDDTARLVPVYAYPTPLGPPHTAEYWVYQGAAQDAIYALFDANCGAAARADRALPGWTRGESSGLGEQITIKAKFDSLLALMAEKCVEGVGLRVEARQSETADAVVFRVLPTNDLRDVILFGIKDGNLSTVTYSEAGPEATVCIVAGEGEGAVVAGKPGSGRTVLEIVDDAQVAEFGRIEAYRDERRARQDTETQGQYEATLRRAGEQELNDKAGGYDVELEVADDDGARFGIDYGLGDLVGVRVGDLRLDATVAEVSLKVDESGAVWTPRVTSTGGAKPDDRHINSIARKLSRISTQVENPTDIQFWRRAFTPGMISLLKPGTAVPALWLVCDGSAGTPSMVGKFVRCDTFAGSGGRAEFSWSHGHAVTGVAISGAMSGTAAGTVSVSGSASDNTGSNTSTNNNTEAVQSGTGAVVADSTHQHPDVHTHPWSGTATFSSGTASVSGSLSGGTGTADTQGEAHESLLPPYENAVPIMFGG